VVAEDRFVFLLADEGVALRVTVLLVVVDNPTARVVEVTAPGFPENVFAIPGNTYFVMSKGGETFTSSASGHLRRE
jgi:hypothetical protein